MPTVLLRRVIAHRPGVAREKLNQELNDRFVLWVTVRSRISLHFRLGSTTKRDYLASAWLEFFLSLELSMEGRIWRLRTSIRLVPIQFSGAIILIEKEMSITQYRTNPGVPSHDNDMFGSEGLFKARR
jgi:hypothetical protein